MPQNSRGVLFLRGLKRRRQRNIHAPCWETLKPARIYKKLREISMYKRCGLKTYKTPVSGTQQGRAQNLGQKIFFPKRPGANCQIAENGAADPINPVNLFFYSFGPFWAKIAKIAKSH